MHGIVLCFPIQPLNKKTVQFRKALCDSVTREAQSDGEVLGAALDHDALKATQNTSGAAQELSIVRE